ncbi:MAG TPA: hypothetical protein VMT85_09500 [Thermoanaerobaculia bacterium]|nr:hypothetical protein [Thermoanaerobaculia bacterium]
MAEAAADLVPRLESDLGRGTVAPYRIVLLPSRRELDPELVRLDELAPPWASGYVLGAYRIGAIRLQQLHRYPVDDAVEVLAHEITHMILFDAAGPGLPRWFGEGVATWEGRRRGLRDLLVTTAALLLDDPPPLAELDRELDAGPARARRAYATSFAFLEWSIRRHGPDLVPRLLDELARARRAKEPGADVDDGGALLADAWREVTGESLAGAEERWRRHALWIHRWLPALAGSGTLWIAVTVLFLVATAARRRRTRALYRRWAAEEARVQPIELDLGPDRVRSTPDGGDESNDQDERARSLVN